MTHPRRARHEREEARDAKCRTEAPPVALAKRAAGGRQPWPTHPRPAGQVHRSHVPPLPQVSFLHTRHAEESAERPHLVTVVRPCGHSALRKVTVLLNRRGVVSFEQLLLDISEALGFPCWHRARVTRLYTTHAREVKGVCDFFRGEMAFLALGKARPELSSVEEALEELFPEYCHYRADALRAWEKKLRPTPDKAAKADSGYSEGTDNELHRETAVKKHTSTQTRHRVDTQQMTNDDPDAQKARTKQVCRKPVRLPNHLQRLHARARDRVRQPSAIGALGHEDDGDGPAPVLCDSCSARRSKQQGPEWMNPLSARVPLPPVLRKQKGSCDSEQEMRKVHVALSPPPPPPVGTAKEKTTAQVPPGNADVGPAEDAEERAGVDGPPRGKDVTLSDIELCYEIGRLVGDGNFAVVRECRRRGDRQTFAMKIVERSKLIGREHMMQNELSLLGSLRHPHIVQLFAHHHTHTHSYLVMELVSGGDLFEAISERGRFSEAEAGLMVSDVSDALAYIHCRSIVHRDIKPENLLLQRGAAGVCRLKLGDFGLAMVVTEPVFTVCGTPTYVAPEILREAGYGVAVDVWALGVILYILLCGFPPFRSRDRDQEELFALIKQGQLHFLSPYWDPISEEARGLVRALLQPEPAVRLTAEQTLLHPWVEAMASACRQRALTHKAPPSTAGNKAAPEGVRRPRAAEAAGDGRAGHTSSGRETTPKELSRAGDEQTPTAHDEDKPPQQRSEEKSTDRATSSRTNEPTPSGAPPGQHKAPCTSADAGRWETQQPGRKLRNTDPSRPSAATAAPTPKREQISQQQSAVGPLSPTDTPPKTPAGPSARRPVSSAAASAFFSPRQQVFTAPLHSPPAASTQNHDRSRISAAVTQPPASPV